MRVRWTSPAVSDLTSIYDYLAGHETCDLAQRLVQAIYSTAHSLAPFPRKGRPGRDPETRELIVQRYPYVVIYELRSDVIHILRVLHTSQQWPA